MKLHDLAKCTNDYNVKVEVRDMKGQLLYTVKKECISQVNNLNVEKFWFDMNQHETIIVVKVKKFL